MKKLLLCSLIYTIMLGNNISAQTSKTPNLDALKQKRDELNNKESAIPYTVSEQDEDEGIKKLKEQKALEIEKNPTMLTLNKEIEELKDKVRNLYPEKYKNISKWEDGIIETSEQSTSKSKEGAITYGGSFSSSYEASFPFEAFFGTNPIVTQLSTKLKEKQNLKDELNKSEKIKELNEKIEQKKQEKIIEARYKKYPELKGIQEELQKIDSKFTQITENPAVKALMEQLRTILYQQSIEEAKIQDQLDATLEKEKENLKKQTETKKRRQEIKYKLNPKLKEIDQSIKALEEKISLAMEAALKKINKKEVTAK